MKTFDAVIALCLVSANAYRMMGPNIAQKVYNGCKQENVNKQIVGGKDAAANQAPWQISLVKSEEHICGGSLVGQRAVLTAAHCCEGLTASSLKVKYGGTDRNNLKVTNSVTKINMHPGYNSETVDNDYSVLCLKDQVKTSSSVQLIPCPSLRPTKDTKVELTGWGYTSGSNNTLPTKLQYVQMSILPRTECDPKWNDINTVTENMICAQSETTSGCNGDSGGPLVAKYNNKYQLVGVVSWGANGCPPNTTRRPAVYADPVTNKAWITDRINECNSKANSKPLSSLLQILPILKKWKLTSI